MTEIDLSGVSQLLLTVIGVISVALGFGLRWLSEAWESTFLYALALIATAVGLSSLVSALILLMTVR